MPSISLVARRTTYSRGADQMCRQESRSHLTEEEKTASEESLSVYCKPIELYNILQRRAIKRPLFLERCLHYKLEEKHKRRVQVSIAISGAIDDGLQTANLFPMYILLARPVSAVMETQYSAIYRFRKACRLTDFCGSETVSSGRAKFVLPEIQKLSAVVKSGSHVMLLVSCADMTNSRGIDLTKDHIFSASSNNGSYCLLGKIPMDLPYQSWEKSPNLSLGERTEMISTVSMRSCFMKFSCSEEGKCVSFHFPYDPETVSIFQQVPVIISAEELGAKDISPYDLYTYRDVPSNSLTHKIRLRRGNVIFNYKYYNNTLQRTEVTEDFACPFCLVKCASYKGLRFHLTASHDLFHYEFWVNEDYRVVIVSVKTDTHNSEGVTNDVDPRRHPIFFCYKPMRRRKPKSPTENANHVHPLVLDSDMPPTINELRGGVNSAERDTASPSGTAGTGHSFVGPEPVQPILGSNVAPPTLLQFAKTRKLSVERSDPRNRMLLQKRQFFHSHRAQPMALEQVVAEGDSEDEVDDDVADLEDRRMLDDFMDVTNDEKQIMHMWNSFIRKQRVLADGHVSWACEAFSKLHGRDLVEAPQLLWSWRLFMIKLWNHGLLDPKSMDNCNVILNQYKSQNESQNQTREVDPTRHER